MARPRGHRNFGSRGQRRLTQWIGPADQGYVNVASAGATLISSVQFVEQQTVVRMRGQVSVKPQVQGADLDVVGAIGVGIVTEEAFTAGIASIPEPFSDADWGGWFVWRSFSYHMQFNDLTGVGWLDWNFEVDSKAMRKVSPNERVVIIVESQVGAFVVSTPLRMLVKLS